MSSLENTMNLKPVLSKQSETLPSVEREAQTDTTEREDYLFARENIRDMIESGSVALSEIMELARLSQHPRAYEVVAAMYKSVLDANKELSSLKDPKKDPEKEKIVNNNLFVGSTNDLLDMLQKGK